MCEAHHKVGLPVRTLLRSFTVDGSGAAAAAQQKAFLQGRKQIAFCFYCCFLTGFGLRSAKQHLRYSKPNVWFGVIEMRVMQFFMAS